MGKLKEKIKQVFGITPDPACDTGFTPEIILNACEETSEAYENIYINKDLFVRLICLSKRGVFFFIPCKTLASFYEAKQAVNTIRTMFGLSSGNSFFFFVWEDSGAVYSENRLLEKDIYKSFRILYENLADNKNLNSDVDVLIEEKEVVKEEKIQEKTYTHDGLVFTMDEDEEDVLSEDRLFKSRVDDKTCERLDKMFTALSGNARPDPNIKTKIDDEGNEWVKKYEAKTLAGFDLGLVGKEQWFPVSDMSTDSLVMKAGVFGFIGLNRFALGQFLTGILYVVTCGCLGILPAFDIIGYLLGNTYYTVNDYSKDGKTKTSQRFYLRKPKNRKLAVLMIFIAFSISFIVFKFVYLNFFSAIGDAVSNNVSQQTIEGLFRFN